MFRYRFLVLLGAIVLFTLISAFLRGFADDPAQPAVWRQVLSFGVFSILLMTAVYAVSERRLETIIAGALISVSILLRVIEVITEPGPESERLDMASDYLGAVFLLCVIAMLLRYLFRTRRVDVDVIACSLCTYMILALAWSLIFTIVSYHDKTAFDVFDPPIAPSSEPEPRKLHDFESIYFSLVTLTTLGYGDITPQSVWSRMLSAMEAVVGQIYLTVLVARLVGLSIAPRPDVERCE